MPWQLICSYFDFLKSNIRFVFSKPIKNTRVTSCTFKLIRKLLNSFYYFRVANFVSIIYGTKFDVQSSLTMINFRCEKFEPIH